LYRQSCFFSHRGLLPSMNGATQVFQHRRLPRTAHWPLTLYTEMNGSNPFHQPQEYIMKLSGSLVCAALIASFYFTQCNTAKAGGNGDEESIRSARLEFNQAIKDQDVAAIGRFLAPEYHIVTGRSQQSHGVAAERELWASTFAKDPTFVCQRDTRELRVNRSWGLSEELGDWNCHFTAEDKTVHASGVYAAKWQRAVNGSWLIQSEVFTTMACEGSEAGCKPPEPIENR
jgi:ketosteroid isomerase-like protein